MLLTTSERARALFFVAALAGCTTELEWSVTGACAPPTVAPDAAPSGGRTVWGVTEGECAPVPGALVARSDGDPSPFRVDRGTYCFWSLALGGECSLRAIDGDVRELPQESRAIESELACLDPADMTVWDRVVERVAGCVPACDPARGCECTGPSCDAESPSPGCPSPINADTVSLARDHGCAAELGGRSVFCWGNRRAFDPETGGVATSAFELAISFGDEATLRALETSADRTCILSQVGRVYCFSEDRPVWGRIARTADDRAIGQATDIAVGDGFGCAVTGLDLDDAGACTTVASNEAPAVVCWGEGPVAGPPGACLEAKPIGPSCTYDREIDCVAAGCSWRPGRCESALVAQDVVAGASHACVIASGQLWCWGDDTVGQVAPRATYGTPLIVSDPIRVFPDDEWLAVTARGDRTCALERNGAVWCWGASATARARIWNRGGDRIGVTLGTDFACVRRASGEASCRRLAGDAVTEIVDLRGAVAGNGVVCGVRTGAEPGALACRPYGVTTGVSPSFVPWDGAIPIEEQFAALFGRGRTVGSSEAICP